mgnify:CR=1 FL=1
MAIGLRATIALLLIGLTSLSLAQSAAFEQCLSDLRQAASDRGVSSQTTSDLLASVTPNPRVIELDRRQPEFTSTLHDYLGRRVTEERIERGQRLLDQHRDQLNALTQEYGVPGRYIIAFWGLETNYGSYVGRMSTVRSLATLACDRRRGAFFRNELIAALELVDRDVLRADQLNGSWAGALGNFQFLPSVYRDHAVDADGDGRADLWSSFADAAESAAAFLRARGWVAGERWGREVILPTGFDLSLLGSTRPVSDWKALGLRHPDRRALSNVNIDATLIWPAGRRGPAFLTYPNFEVIMRWNPSQFYALAVGHLADRQIGASALANPPPDDPPLAIAQVRQIQQTLNQRGHNAGQVDGRIGPATRAALRAFQIEQDLPADGYPDPQTLAALGIEREDKQPSTRNKE